MGNLKMKKAQLSKAHKTQPTQSLFQNRKNTRFSPNFIVFFCAQCLKNVERRSILVQASTTTA